MNTTRKILISSIWLFIIIILSSCAHDSPRNLQNVGLLLDSYLEDEEWNQGGYTGLQRINEQLKVDVFIKENVQTKHDIIDAVDALEHQGVNLIFGHSNRYGKMLVDVAKMYPDIHFVYFNGGYFRENVTSLNISSHASGFFSGMTAGKMTDTDHVGIIAAYEWQPEIEGFFEGVKFENPEAVVHIDYINAWDNQEMGIHMYNQMIENEIDVIYPIGHSFSKQIIKQAMEDGIFSIGYFLQDENYDTQLLLTSTIQHIDLLYVETAEKFNDELLEGGIYSHDFTESAVTLGEFSPLVPRDFKKKLQRYITEYKETGLLPNEISTNK